MTSHYRQNPGVDRDVEPYPAQNPPQQNAVIFNWKACEAGSAAAHPSTVRKLQSLFQECSN